MDAQDGRSVSAYAAESVVEDKHTFRARDVLQEKSFDFRIVVRFDRLLRGEVFLDGRTGL